MGISNEIPVKLLRKNYLISQMKLCDNLHLPLIHCIAVELHIPGEITVSCASKRSASERCIFARS